MMQALPVPAAASSCAHAAPRLQPARLAMPALAALLAFAVLSPTLLEAMGHAGAGEGNVLRQAAYVVFLLLAWAAASASGVRATQALPTSLLVAFGWCALSLAWAYDPGTGVRRLLLTAMVAWTLFLLVASAGYGRTVTAVRWLLALLLAANFMAVLVWPTASIHQAALEADPSIVGAWHGVLAQKNFAGAVCALTVVFFTLDAGRVPALLRMVVVVGAAVFLYFSASKTSAGMLVAALGLGLGHRLYDPYFRIPLFAALALLLVLLGVVGYEHRDLVEDLLLDPRAFTGRAQIWNALAAFAAEHPLGGAGFGSFWNVTGVQPIARHAQGWVAEITSGHNGYLDLLVQLGWPGLVLAVWALVLAPLARLLKQPRLDPRRASLVVACVVFGGLHNLSESSLLDRDAAVYVFMLLAIALLHSGAVDAVQAESAP